MRDPGSLPSRAGRFVAHVHMAHYASEPLAKYMHAPRLRTTCAHVCVKSYKVATESASDPEQLTALLATHGYAETLLYSALHPDPTYLLGLSDGRDADRATSTIVHMVRWHSRRTVITERFTAPEKFVLTVLQLRFREQRQQQQPEMQSYQAKLRAESGQLGVLPTRLLHWKGLCKV